MNVETKRYLTECYSISLEYRNFPPILRIAAHLFVVLVDSFCLKKRL